MNKLLIIIFVCLLSVNSFAFDVENGKALHEENCTRCHDSTRYTRADRKIQNYEKLRARVSQCELMLELAWFDEEVDDVTAYLNNQFYHFDLDK